MQRIKAVIIDDEAPARDVIKNYLHDFPDINIAAECDNGFDGYKMINEIKPELIFLDIQMPKITGFELLELLAEPPVIIFSTAYDHYALKAFEVSAADYLLKPYSKDRCAEAINKALVFIKNKKTNKKIISSLLNQHDENNEYLQRVVVKTGAQIFIIPTTKLLRLEAQDDYVMLYTQENNFLKEKPMYYFEKHLDPDDFIRIHRSHIVRLSFIKQLELHGKESYKAILKDSTSLPVSKSGHARLKQILN